jgi:predicted dehydrogenase
MQSSSEEERKLLHVGVIGGGLSGTAHVRALRRTGLAASVTLAGSSRASAEAARRRLDVDAVTDDYRRLLADDGIDVVHVCVPNDLHAEVIAAAFEAGKHVIAEKPLAVTSAEADELERRASASKLVHAVCFNYRFYPLVLEARARIARGELGAVALVHGGYLQDWLLRREDYDWRVDSQRGGRSRTVADIGSHWADLAAFLLGSFPTEVFATLGRMHPYRQPPAGRNGAAGETDELPVDTEDWGALLLRFETGVVGQALVSQVSPGSKNRLWLQVDGSEAALSWEQQRPEELWIGRRGRPNEIVLKDAETLSPAARAYVGLPAGHPEGWHDALANLVRTVYRTVQDGVARDFPTFTDGAAGVRVVEAALESAPSGRWAPIRDAAASGPRLIENARAGGVR